LQNLEGFKVLPSPFPTPVDCIGRSVDLAQALVKQGVRFIATMRTAVIREVNSRAFRELFKEWILLASL